MREHLLTVLGYLWSAFGVYWVAVAVRRKPATAGPPLQANEPHLFRVARLSILATTFALLFWQRLSIGFPGRRFVPTFPFLDYAGFVITLIGLAVAAWARIHLGQQWSDKVIVQSGHQLIRTGPYAHMRHPIYSGVLLGVAGTALVVGEWRGLMAFLLLFANYVVKARKEDRILAEHFGESYVRHARGAGFLLPKFRSRA
jgi:protein-S-isoprenylcysteine O-methyltransferase Ste14